MDSPGTPGSDITGGSHPFDAIHRGSRSGHPHRPADGLDGQAGDSSPEELLVGLLEPVGQQLAAQVVERGRIEADGDLPSLTGVTHENPPFGLQSRRPISLVGGGQGCSDHPGGFVGQLGQHPVGCLVVKVGGQGVVATEGLVGDRGPEEPDS